jgi:hypothetical protein
MPKHGHVGWTDTPQVRGCALVAVRANTGVEAAWVYHMVEVNRGRRLRGGVWSRQLPGC